MESSGTIKKMIKVFKRNTDNCYEIKFTYITSFVKFFSGIQTSQDARFYALSKKFTPFNNKDKTLVIQFTVKHEQNIDCGGGYVKEFACSLDQKDMHGESPYQIMFGKFLISEYIIDSE